MRLVLLFTLVFSQQISFGPDISTPVKERTLAYFEAFLDPLDTVRAIFLGESGPFDCQEFSSEEFHIVRNSTFLVVCGPGSNYGVYEILMRFGVVLLNPFSRQIPKDAQLDWWVSTKGVEVEREKPDLSVRGLHYHTEHPLELVEYLNGFDAVLGDGNVVEWAAMEAEWADLCEWMVAHRLNRVEWILLYAEEWKEEAWGEERRSRVRSAAGIAREFGLEVGIDFGIAITQQHDWPLSGGVTDWPLVQANIRSHLAWLLNETTLIDYLSTESGFSEFTSPSCSEMLKWMNFVAHEVAAYGRECFIKVHCSRGQTCEELKNPFNGRPLDFNMLPVYADPSLGVYPHTVEMYNFSQPAPVYGNSNFSYMREFLIDVATQGERKVVYHGEGAYWVNVDVDVPLFLPVYGLSRLQDIKSLAAVGGSYVGEVNFNSGFAYGYWVQEVSIARAAWNSSSFESTLSPLRLAFGEAGPAAVALLGDLCMYEADALILGRAGGQAPSADDITMRNGIAYLSGWDTWIELEALFVKDMTTQPTRLGIEQVRFSALSPVSYVEHVRPLLASMNVTFRTFADRFAALRPRVPRTALPVFDEIDRSLRLTALRAQEVADLYEYAWSWGARRDLLDDAKAVLTRATALVHSAAAAYPISSARVAGWRPNPTAYGYGFTWTAKSLYYWWRDYARAVLLDPEATLDPCYLNIDDPANIAFGEGIAFNISAEIYHIFEENGLLKYIGDCLGAPKEEPHYPEDL